jgi:hypothetical protein
MRRIRDYFWPVAAHLGAAGVDNVSQAGPYFAAVDFLSHNSDWIDCGFTSNLRDRARAFDQSRSIVAGTDFMVLRAPTCYIGRTFAQLWGNLVGQAAGIRAAVIARWTTQHGGTNTTPVAQPG